MSERLRTMLVILSSGIVLSNIVVASSSTFGAYAPVTMSSNWLIIGSMVSGLLLGFSVRDEAVVILYGVFLMALIAAAGYTGVLSAVTWLSGSRILDIILVYALQQMFPRMMSILIFGYLGAFGAVLVRLASGRL